MKSSRYLLIIGGFIAFTLTFFVAFFSGNEVSNALLKASIASIIGVFLMKYLIKVLIIGVYESQIEKNRQLEEQQETPSQQKINKEMSPTPENSKV